jgi:hypothetical protein
MEAKLTELKGHTNGINAALAEVCSGLNFGPLVWENDLVISTFDSGTLSRRVTTDLGSSEFAVRLPIPDVNAPRFWIALHERWGYKNKHTIRFLDLDSACISVLEMKKRFK